MKIPSELDITLLRDLCDKFFTAYPVSTDGTFFKQCTVNLSVIHMQQRKDSLRRFLDHYEAMSKELSQLILEKYRRD